MGTGKRAARWREAASEDEAVSQRLQGLLDGRFGLPRSRTAIAAPGWPIQYGLGIMRFRITRLVAPGFRPATLLGHSGASGSWLFHCPERDLYLAGTVDQTSAAAVPFRLQGKALRACQPPRAG